MIDFNSNSEINRHVRELHKTLADHYDSPEPRDRDVISKYQWEPAFFNKPLVSTGGLVGGPNHGKLKKAIERFGSVGTPQDITTFSGVGRDHGKKLARISSGSTVHFPAWTSTSISPLVATAFAYRLKGSEGGGMKHLATFHVPQGFKHGAYIDHLDSSWQEKEFLMKPGMKWQKTGETHVPVSMYDAGYHWKSNFGGGMESTVVMHHFEPKK